MYRTYNDLRLVRLALHFEDTFERYERHLRDLLPHASVRARLAGLFEEGPSHRALRRAHDRLARQARQAAVDPSPEDVLQTLVDCETWAAAFYRANLDRLSDPDLVELFRRLAQEEDAHARLVHEARSLLGDLDRLAAPQPLRPSA